MRFDWEPSGRRLHPVRLAKAEHFAGERLLLLLRTHVFDDAIAERQVEGTIGELMDVARVALDVTKRVDARSRRNWFEGLDPSREVQDRDIQGYRHIIPNDGATTQIEHASPGLDLQHPHEGFHPAPSGESRDLREQAIKDLDPEAILRRHWTAPALPAGRSE